MHRTQIYIEEEIFQKARKESEILGVSISEFIRMSIKKNIQKNSTNNINVFFDNLKPLESFKDINPKKYVDNIRSKSRILTNNE
ncbi:MAG: hypothetical protein EVJ48_06310 [Candidatus Acidulodesulfobacterium acidiphilum]|uniref:DUF1778 domain-containing protein n=1 Tax=Candidatus Acidulodesulfobacterium acidiphilum TaxID=2597224 RepID=A0A520XBY0_9DELT|nr:MAG: hypothetical protein EVJ48_06310 [Candidatus Acidulodesulfobacterium acidiphilum]